MVYILGVSPDEFGLVPDREGYIDIKTFLQAIHEEPNMGYVREYHVKEVLLWDKNDNFHVEGKKISYTKKNFTITEDNGNEMVTPKILFKGVKRKAYPHILKYGLLPGKDDYVSMAKDKDFAIHIAKRIDQKPVVLEINAGLAINKGIHIFPFGKYLFLAENVPAEFIQGPPLPKETFKEKIPPKKEMDKSPGTFTLKTEKDPDLRRRTKAKKHFTWKEEAKKSRKKKRNHTEKDWEGLF